LGLQTKLKVNEPGDIYEQEADRIADQVLATPAHPAVGGALPRIQRFSGQSNGQMDAAPASVNQALASPGSSLDPAIRQDMGRRFGHDFSRVRVHSGASAEQSARAVNAHAYTVGHNVVFGAGRFAPGTHGGRRLIAHELTHVVQQAQTEAASLHRQAAGESEGKEQKGEEKNKEAAEVVVEGLKTVAEQAVDNNPYVKKEIIEPFKKTFKGKWEELPTSEKAGIIGFGAATLGITAGPLLADPKGRKMLEGVNLAAPLKLIPYMPLTGFKYTLPSGETEEKGQFRFETTFSLDDYLKLRSERTGLPPISLQIGMQWGYDPKTERLSVIGAQVQLGLVPGVTLSGGAYTDILPTPQVFTTPEGGTVESRQRIPELPKPVPRPDVRIMLNVDLLKLNPATLGKQIQQIFGIFR
jgi:hypothetical protein